MSKNRKLSIPRLLCLMLTLLCLSACKEKITHNLSESEANRIVTTLHEANLQPEKVRQPDGKWAVAVPRSKAHDALTYLADRHIFRQKRPSSKEQSGFLLSREDQLFRFERALSTEIESTLLSITGVLEARVHLNIPRSDPLFGRPLDKGNQGSASVLLISTEQLSMTQEQIAQLVSGASGIAQSSISVLFTKWNDNRDRVAEVEDTDDVPLVEYEVPQDNLAVAGSYDQEKVINGNFLTLLDQYWQIPFALFLILAGVQCIREALKPRKKTTRNPLSLRLQQQEENIYTSDSAERNFSL